MLSTPSEINLFKYWRSLFPHFPWNSSLTIVSASSLESDQKFSGTNIEGASKIGTLIADRAIKKGVKSVVFDRGGYKHHGRVKALAEAARSAGLKF